MFTLPQNGEVYTSTVIQRCEKLIQFNLWQGVDKRTLHLWLRNFESSEERYFAACILDSTIYRSNPQTYSLLRQLFQCVLPNVISDLNLDVNFPLPFISDWLVNLNRSTRFELSPKVRLVPVIRSDSPTKSGFEISRFISRQLHINKDWIVSPGDVPELLDDGVEVIVFFDDFLGTGQQFIEFIDDENQIDISNTNVTFIYSPLVAHYVGIEAIESRFQTIKVFPVEFLNDNNSIFSDECHCFDDGVNDVNKARDFYYEMLEKKSLDFSGYRNGFGDLELAYGFEHAAPDNCLPILWWCDDTTKWQPLFKR